MNVTGVKLNCATELRNCFFPMSQPPLDSGDREGDIKIIRKSLFGSPEFLERPGEITPPVLAIIAKNKMRFR